MWVTFDDIAQDAILDEERKKHRFRKMIEKRRRMDAADDDNEDGNKDAIGGLTSMFSTRPVKKRPKKGEEDNSSKLDLVRKVDQSTSTETSFRNVSLIFFINGPIPAPFWLFSSFSHYNFNNTNWKSVDGVQGIWTCGCMMVGADDTTELWKPGLVTAIIYHN